MGDLFSELRRLRVAIELSRLDFIRKDLGVCLTLAKVAETATSMGNSERAQRTIASAEKGAHELM